MYRMAMLLGLLVAIMSVSAYGVGFIGTPTAELKQGQWNVGFNYMYSDMELAKTKMTGSEVGVIEADGVGEFPFSDAYSFKLEIDDVKTQRYYGTIGYGLMNSLEVYVQLGIADLKARTRDADEPDEWSGLNFDNDFAWGWGTRYTFYEQGTVRWGASLQMNWLDTSWGEKSVYDDDIQFDGFDVAAEVVEDVQIDWSSFDLLLAVGPTVDMGNWNLYGGPFYYMVSGDLDVTVTNTACFDTGVVSGSGVGMMKESGDIEEDSNFGGFVGAQCTVMEKYDVTTEISFTGDGWAIGAGVCCAF